MGYARRHDRHHDQGVPKAETEVTVLIEGLDDATACRAMTVAMGSAYDVSGAAHLPDHIAPWFDNVPESAASTLLRLEGFAPSVTHRRETLTAHMKGFGPVTLLDERKSRDLWRSIRNVKPFAAEGRSVHGRFGGACRQPRP